MTNQQGNSGQYCDAKGGQYAAVILLAAEDFDEARAPAGVRILAPGEVTLEVARPSGAHYVRAYVPLEASPPRACRMIRSRHYKDAGRLRVLLHNTGCARRASAWRLAATSAA